MSPTALVSHIASSTTTGPNSSATQSSASASNFVFKAWHPWCTISLPMGLKKPLTDDYEATQEVCHLKLAWYKLGKCLWAYRMTIQTLTKATPFFLLYGFEVVLPLEGQILLISVSLLTGMIDREWNKCCEQLKDQEKTWHATQHNSKSCSVRLELPEHTPRRPSCASSRKATWY